MKFILNFYSENTLHKMRQIGLLPWLLFTQILIILTLHHSSIWIAIWLAGILFLMGYKKFIWGIVCFFLGLLTWFSSPHQQHATSELQTKSNHIGSVSEFPVLQPRGTSLKVLLANTNKTVKLFVAESCPLWPSSKILWSSTLKPPKFYNNPGAFNYAKYLYRQQIEYIAFVNKCADIQILVAPELTFLQSARIKMLHLLNQVASGASWNLPPLIMGMNSLSSEQNASLLQTGLSHLFVISGAQFALMNAMLYFLLSKILDFGFFKIYRHIPRQKLVALCGFFFSFLYMHFILPQPSVFRAGSMAMILFFVILYEKKMIWWQIVLFASFIQLHLMPLSLFDLSFQLSYLCILLMGVIWPRLGHYLMHVKGQLKIVVQFILGTWILQLLLLPWLLSQFGLVSLAGLFYNLLAIPIFDLLVTPLVCIILVLFLWNDSLTLWFIHLLHIFTEHFFDYLKIAPAWMLQIPMPNLTILTICYILLFIYIGLKQNRILYGMFFLIVASYAVWSYQKFYKYDFSYSQLDVGQGEASVLRQGRHVVMIDTGGLRHFDLAKNIWRPYFLREGIRRIDALFLTHADFDHYGALSELLEQITINTIILPQGVFNSPNKLFAEQIEKARNKGVVIHIAQEHEKWLFGKMKFKAIWPAHQSELFRADNNRSLVLQVLYSDKKLLFTGDIEAAAERLLLQHHPHELGAHVLKLAHHGSKRSSTIKFLQTVQPEHVFISAGTFSPYGHPHKESLNRINEVGAKIWRTDTQGCLFYGVKADQEEVSLCSESSW